MIDTSGCGSIRCDDITITGRRRRHMITRGTSSRSWNDNFRVQMGWRRWCRHRRGRNSRSMRRDWYTFDVFCTRWHSWWRRSGGDDTGMESPTSLFFLFRPNSIRWDVATLLLFLPRCLACYRHDPHFSQPAYAESLWSYGTTYYIDTHVCSHSKIVSHDTSDRPSTSIPTSRPCQYLLCQLLI